MGIYYTAPSISVVANALIDTFYITLLLYDISIVDLSIFYLY
ncbi:hypothetical protein ASY01nite_24530 [Acetobacter syzygii]|nr:hypothetical protein Absy_044_004 [Acetobacter syzygii]GEL57387.1 hypothetical protein ASY01nite_24530 [Acetobacter syzygii]